MKRNLLAALVVTLPALVIMPTGALSAPAGLVPKDLSDVSLSAQALANTLDGPGVTVSSGATLFTGAANAGGTFTSTDSSIVGFGSGVVLSTGWVKSKENRDVPCLEQGVEGPNECNFGSASNETGGDPALTTLSGTATFDTAALQFEFVPTGNQITLQYVFGSEDYLEGIGAGYSDAVGIFVNGTNCATAAPGVRVSVDTINQAVRPTLFRNNPSLDGGGTPTINAQPDGLTKVLTCTSPANAGVANTMRIAIADVGDKTIDSNAFFKAGSLASGLPRRVAGDYDGSGTSDVALYRTSNGTWYTQGQGNTAWGGDGSDKAEPGDYDGDGDTDLAVYRKNSGTWYINRLEGLPSDISYVQWGGDGSDIAVPGDYDGDGDTDVAVYRVNTGIWYVNGLFNVAWGGDGSDVPVPGDYDGDGDTDLAVYRKDNGTWFINRLEGLPSDISQDQWGGDITDKVAPADYDDDGDTDLAVYRALTGYWYVKGQAEVAWGGDSSDKPIPGDFNSDGKADVAVYRGTTGYWYVKGQFDTRWGGDSTDVPAQLPAALR